MCVSILHPLLFPSTRDSTCTLSSEFNGLIGKIINIFTDRLTYYSVLLQGTAISKLNKCGNMESFSQKLF